MERADYDAVVLERRPRDALERLNPGLLAEPLDDAFHTLTQPEGSTLVTRKSRPARHLAQLQEGMCERERFLTLVRDFIVFEDDGGGRRSSRSGVRSSARSFVAAPGVTRSPSGSTTQKSPPRRFSRIRACSRRLDEPSSRNAVPAGCRVSTWA